MKKILSLILCALMMVSILPMNAIALDVVDMDILEAVFAAETAESLSTEEPIEKDPVEITENISIEETDFPKETAETAPPPAETAEEIPVAETEQKSDALLSSSGTCGKSVTWSLSDSGVLTISGTGAMTNYSPAEAPWYNIRNSITSIVIQSGVTNVGAYSFYKCSNATTISLPESITLIGANAFQNCTGLTTLSIPDSVSTIGTKAFSHCSNLARVYLSANITNIDDYTFYECNSLSSISIPIGVTNIGSYAFYNCINLKSVTIPNRVATIRAYAFRGCSSLTSVIIPNSVTNIWESAFYKCERLKIVTIPESVTKIGNSAFQYCTSLTAILIGNKDCDFPNPYYNLHLTLGVPGTTIVYGLPGSTAETYANNYGYEFIATTTIAALGSCGSNLTWTLTTDGTLTISGTGEMDAVHAPWGTDIKRVIIEPGVTSIGHSAFFDCSKMTDITIPDSVTTIGSLAFYNCSDIKHLLFIGSEAQWKNVRIDGINNSLSALTPCCSNDPNAVTYVKTCTSTCLHCSVCEKDFAITEKPGGAHTWDNGTISTAPTIKSDGVLTYTCNACSETKTESLPALSFDINSDGVTNTQDLISLMRHIIGTKTAENTAAADVNGDNFINLQDSICLLKHLAA